MQNSKSNITDLRPSQWSINDADFVLGLRCVIVDVVTDISEVHTASTFRSKCVGWWVAMYLIAVRCFEKEWWNWPGQGTSSHFIPSSTIPFQYNWMVYIYIYIYKQQLMNLQASSLKKMDEACGYKTSATSPTVTQCNNPRTELSSNVTLYMVPPLVSGLGGGVLICSYV
jgi:hypothetical protein